MVSTDVLRPHGRRRMTSYLPELLDVWLRTELQTTRRTRTRDPGQLDVNARIEQVNSNAGADLRVQ